MNLISRTTAHTEGLPRYYTGISCKNGHVSERYVSTGGCIDCLNKYRDKYSRHSPTSTLTRWKPQDAFFVPVGLDAKQLIHLNACLQHWVVQWAAQQNIELPPMATDIIERLVRNLLTASK